ncbi:hypothetical protein GGH94_006242 [Coemansia aciculifera]|uniref:Uncharacterized protein n=1 Tax=Coemansia aciculifera TaxID=417176 RepID=A0A9W8M1V3_9FUNG|nr:hypothetical protein GGH94_006242 [Coemansia aciculifera]
MFMPPVDVVEANYKLLSNLLFSTLCQGGIKGVHVYAEQVTIPVSLDVQALPGLTSIYQGHNVFCTPFVQLAYRNAGTLKALDVDVGAEEDWLSLVYGGTQVSATFSSLVEHALTLTDVPYDTTWTVIDNVSPFPVLSPLKVYGNRYPFNDNLLFRGNGKMMKHLRIPFCALARNSGRFDIFRRSDIVQMNLVCIGPILDLDNAFVAERGEAIIRLQLHRVLETSAALVRKAFSREISWAMVHMPFKPFADSIRRLMFED